MEIAEKAGTLLEGMVTGVRKTSELIQDISASGEEQTDGIAQVNKAIQQLDQIIQQNAASAEEMAAASRDFSGRAEQLLRIASFFRIYNDSLRKTDDVQPEPPAVRAERKEDGMEKIRTSCVNKDKGQTEILSAERESKILHHTKTKHASDDRQVISSSGMIKNESPDVLIDMDEQDDSGFDRY